MFTVVLRVKTSYHLSELVCLKLNNVEYYIYNNKYKDLKSLIKV